MRIVRLALVAMFTALAAGCGSGGAGGNIVDPVPVPQHTAILEFGTTALPHQSVIYGVEFTVRLPAGVTVSADASGEVLAGVLDPVDDGAFAGARYLPSTATDQASVKILITDSSGFPIGKLATLHCLVATGTTLDAGAFSLDGFSARDMNGAAVPGVTPHFTLQTQ